MEMPFNPITTGSPVIMPKAVPIEPKKEKDIRLKEIKTHVDSLSKIIGKANSFSATKGSRELESSITATKVELTKCQEMIKEIDRIKSPDLQEKKIAFLKSAAWVGAVALAAFGAVAAAITFPAVPMATLGALLLLTAALIVIKETGESYGKDAGVISDDSSFIKKAVVTFGLAPFMPFYEIYKENQDNKARAKEELGISYESLKSSFNENYGKIKDLLDAGIKNDEARLEELRKEANQEKVPAEKMAEINSESEQLFYKMHTQASLPRDLENLRKLFNPSVASAAA